MVCNLKIKSIYNSSIFNYYVNHYLTTIVDNWRSPTLSELTPMIFKTGLTHLGSEVSNYSTRTLRGLGRSLDKLSWDNTLYPKPIIVKIVTSFIRLRAYRWRQQYKNDFKYRSYDCASVNARVSL